MVGTFLSAWLDPGQNWTTLLKFFALTQSNYAWWLRRPFTNAMTCRHASALSVPPVSSTPFWTETRTCSSCTWTTLEVMGRRGRWTHTGGPSKVDRLTYQGTCQGQRAGPAQLSELTPLLPPATMAQVLVLEKLGGRSPAGFTSFGCC